MKQIFLLLFAMIASIALIAQSSNAPAELADKIARNMKNALALSTQQKDSIYVINIDISNKKKAMRQQHAGDIPLITTNLQQIENTRDSLYRTVLTEQQFILYKKKKVNLVNNN